MISQLTLDQVQAEFRKHQNTLDDLTVRNPDFKGRRITNAGKSVGDFDYVVKMELQDAITEITSRITATDQSVGLLNAAQEVRRGAFATRGAAAAHINEVFIASDHNNIAWYSTGATWLYLTGVKSVTQANLATFTANLGGDDAGLLINISDFTHLLKWTGSTTDFAPGDSGSGYISFFPFQPTGGTWGPCDGTTYSYLNADGTTSNFATPDYSTAAYIKGGTSATIGPTAAGGVVSSENTHTHSVDPPSTTSGAPSATTTVDNDGGGSTVAVGSATHTHATDIAPFTSGAGSAHDHGPNTLELRRSVLIGYFRR